MDHDTWNSLFKASFDRVPSGKGTHRSKHGTGMSVSLHSMTRKSVVGQVFTITAYGPAAIQYMMNPGRVNRGAKVINGVRYLRIESDPLGDFKVGQSAMKNNAVMRVGTRDWYPEENHRAVDVEYHLHPTEKAIMIALPVAYGDATPAAPEADKGAETSDAPEADSTSEDEVLEEEPELEPVAPPPPPAPVVPPPKPVLPVAKVPEPKREPAPRQPKVSRTKALQDFASIAASSMANRPVAKAPPPRGTMQLLVEQPTVKWDIIKTTGGFKFGHKPNMPSFSPEPIQRTILVELLSNPKRIVGLSDLHRKCYPRADDRALVKLDDTKAEIEDLRKSLLVYSVDIGSINNEYVIYRMEDE